jgi:transcriptional regulator GlxA family with amidase domain
MNMGKTGKVAILIFEDVEILDFCGPFEVFSVTGKGEGEKLFQVFTVAEEAEPIRTANGLSVNPDHDLANCPQADVLVIPGGWGSRAVMKNDRILDWLKQASEKAGIVLSVCTGSLILGRAGILDGLAATTYHTAFDALAEAAPKTEQRPGERFVDNGKVITSAGVSAGIDAALHVVEKLTDRATAQQTADYMEYRWVD